MLLQHTCHSVCPVCGLSGLSLRDARRSVVPFFQGGLTFEKCVNHRTFWCGVACTSSDGFRQDTFDPREIGYFRLHIFKMRLSNGLDLSAGLRPVIDQPEQPANFFQGETEIAGPHDELQPFDMNIIIASIPFCGARWVGHDTDRLVVADGFEIAARGPC